MTVYYERYRNDYDHQEQTAYVDGYEGLEKWIRQTSQEKFYGDYDGWGAFYASHDVYCARPELLSNWEFEPYGQNGIKYWIHMIKNDNGEIIFSDGRYTRNEKFQTKRIFELGARLYKEAHDKNVQFNFSNADAV